MQIHHKSMIHDDTKLAHACNIMAMQHDIIIMVWMIDGSACLESCSLVSPIPTIMYNHDTGLIFASENIQPMNLTLHVSTLHSFWCLLLSASIQNIASTASNNITNHAV